MSDLPHAPADRPSDPTAAPLSTIDAAKRQKALQKHWKTNLTIMAGLLSVWAIVSLGCGVLFADWLNQYRLGGIPLGFWFAQQGSIIVFVFLILIYAILLNRLDQNHHDELMDGTADAQGQAAAASKGGDQ